MKSALYWIPAIAFVLSLLLTAAVRRLALARDLVDVPNERSSHAVPTPRGGGLAIVITMLFAAGIGLFVGVLDRAVVLALTGGGLAIAAIGFADDRRPVPSSLRLVVHLFAAAWAMYWLGGLPPLRFGVNLHEFGAFGYVLGVIGLVWAVNLFNFMDGIDGLAASEAIFVTGAAFAVLGGGGSGAGMAAMAILMLALAAASAGFLAWNWPPARLFMGDVGSGYLGFAIGVLAIACARHDPLAIPVWAILGAVFIADTTVTLCIRLLRGERVYQAHRTHGYQLLTQRWGSHRLVTLVVCAFNVFVLLPSAFCVTLWPAQTAWLLTGALVLPGCAALMLGAGRKPN